MFVMTRMNHNMTEESNSLPDTLPDNASDYGDFGSDAEEIQILDNLLAQVAPTEDAQNQTLLVTDIEDYEPPHGILLPKDLITTRPAQFDTIEILHIQTESGTSYVFDASNVLTC